MNCPKCNSQIPEGKLFCPTCGTEIQIVPDYNLFEEDLLSSMLSEDEKKKMDKIHEGQRAKIKEENKRINKRIAVFIGIALAVAIFVIIGISLYFNSYNHMMKKGNEYLAGKDYEGAYLEYIAAAEKKDSAEAYTKAAQMLIKLENLDEAEKLLREALKYNPSYKEAYKELINVFIAKNDYEEIAEIKAGLSDPDLLSLFDGIITVPVRFSQRGGDYDDDVTLKLSVNGDYDIYYTTNGSEPTKGNGTLYTEPIVIDEGKTTVKACCIGQDGSVGAIATEEYYVSYEKPEDPVVNPESGNYEKPEKITISASGNCKIYYTWDETAPNVNSSEYTGPIDMPEGNNVLSVIAINSHDMTSEIIKKNYIYQP